MGRSRTVARFAAHTQFRPGGIERLRARVVPLAEIGRVAVRAHEVPVLPEPGPVQWIGRRDPLAGIQVEPPLSPGGFWPGIPGNAQRLQAPARHRYQILLERIESEGVADFEVSEFTVAAVGTDVEPPVALVEGRRDPGVRKRRLLKLPENGSIAGLGHGAGVLGPFPRRRFGRMTARAHLAADVGR